MRRRALTLILLVAAAIRLAALAAAWNHPSRLLSPDSRDYFDLSASLATKGEFQRGGQAEIFRTPGYPVFLAFPLWFGPLWRQAAGLAQIGLGVMTVYLTYLLGGALWSRRAGLWAAGLEAIDPLSIAVSVRILSDGPFAMLLVLSILLLVCHFQTSRAWTAGGATAVLALACYVRPAGILPLVIALVLLGGRAVAMTWTRRTEARAAGRAFLASAVVALVAIAPWAARNWLAAGYPGFSSVTEINAFHYEAPAVLAEVEGVSFRDAQTQLTERLAKRLDGCGPSVPPAQLAAAKAEIAGAVLREHPGRWVVVHLRESTASLLPGITDLLEVLGVTAGQRGTLAVLREQGLWAAAGRYFQGAEWAAWLCVPAVLLLAAEYVLAIFGAIRHGRAGAAGWLILLTVAALLLAGGPAATPRFRVPVTGLIAVLAASAWEAVLSRRSKGVTNEPRPASGVLRRGKP